jgi:hypothetical protein
VAEASELRAGSDGGASAVTSLPDEQRPLARLHRKGLAPEKVVLIAVIAVFVAISSVISIKTPAWESNDEPDHVLNIETLAAGHWYGLNNIGPVHVVDVYGRIVKVVHPRSGAEPQQPPLYYLLLAGWQRVVGVPIRTPNPGPRIFYIGQQSFRGTYMHHSASDHRFLLWLRFPNVVFGALTIWFTFSAARIATRDRWTPVVAASIVGFLPRFVFVSSFVTNDNLVNLLGAALTFASLHYVVSPSRWRMALVSSIVGLLVITKLSALPLAAILLVLALVPRDWKQRAQLIVIGFATTFLVCGWYLIQNSYRYGSPLAQGATQRYLIQVGGIGLPYGMAYRVVDPIRYVLINVPARFIDIFWYGSGWNEVEHWPWPVGLLFWLGLGLALVGLVGRRTPRKILLALGVIAATGLLSVWIVAFQTATYDPRLALAGAPALACLAALGLERRKLWVRSIFPLALLGGLLFAVQTDVLQVHWS